MNRVESYDYDDEYAYDDGDYGYEDDDGYGYEREDEYGDGAYSQEEKMILERKNTSEIQSMRNFKHELLEPRTLKSNLTSKVSSIQQSQMDFNLDVGDYWNALRKNEFNINKSKTWLNDRIIDLMTTKAVKEPLKGKNQDCMVCFENYQLHEMYQAGCNHTFCEECYKEFQHSKIGSGPNCVEMTCPMKGCPFMVWDNLITKVLGNEDKYYEKYQKYLLDDFVKWSPTIIYCPAPDCTVSIEVDEKMLSNNGKIPQRDISCRCEAQVCLRCSNYGHEPLDCNSFREWEDNLEKKKDKLSGFWMSTHTKKCPKCDINVEKAGGCMHMTCVNCKYDFCWMCRAEWKKHGNNTGGYYKCNIYKEDPNEKSKQSEAERDMKRLEFYLDRYTENKKSFKSNLDQLEKFKKQVYEKKKGTGKDTPMYILQSQIPKVFDFYLEALRLVVKVRNFITYTYPLAFNILNASELELFAENQFQLTSLLEALNKNLDDNAITEFVKTTNGEYTLSMDFPQRAKKITEVKNLLSCQLLNAEKDFTSKSFLERIKTISSAPIIIPKATKKEEAKANKKKATPNEEFFDWYCSQCTFYNQGNRTNNCTCCSRNGKPARPS